MVVIGGGEAAPLIEAPTLAEIIRRIRALPHYLLDRPLEVDPQTWRMASAEITAVMEARGWYVAVADIDRPNFLLQGIPIVMGE